MGGGIISSLLKLIKDSFIKYLDYHINTIAVLAFLFAIFASIFNINEFVKTNVCLTLMIIALVIFLISLHYYNWYKNNFNKVKISKKALIIIEGRDERNLSMEISKLTIPSEDLLILTLIIEFGEFIRDELINKTYTLLIKKPETLDIKFMNNTKSKPYIIDNGFNSPFYCINMKYNNNILVELLFELQADETTYGDFTIYFLEEEITKDFEKIIKHYNKLTEPQENLFEKEQKKKEKLSKQFEKIALKKSHAYKETVYTRDVEINKGDCIIIDKKT